MSNKQVAIKINIDWDDENETISLVLPYEVFNQPQDKCIKEVAKLMQLLYFGCKKKREEKSEKNGDVTATKTEH